MVAVVSAAAGLGLTVGSGVAGLLSNLHVARGVVFGVAYAGAVAGTVLGARLASTWTRGGPGRFRAMVLGGIPGLAVAIAFSYVAYRTSDGLLALLSLLCPGIGAAFGASFAERRPG